MTKILKSKVFWVILVLILIVGFFGYKIIFPQKTTEYVTQDVVRGEIVQTVSATGKVKPASEISLNFKNSGKISAIDVKIGDKVTKDQILARQKAVDLQASVDKARANLIQAQANLTKLKSGAITQDVAVYEVALQKAVVDLENVKTDLENTKRTYAQAIESKQSSALLDMRSALAKADVSMQKVDDIMNYKNNPSNLTVSDFNLLDTVKQNIITTESAMSLAKSNYEAANSTKDLTSIKTALTYTQSALADLSETLGNLSKLLNTAITNNNLTLTEIDTLKASVSVEWVTTNTSVSTIQASAQAVEDAQLTYQTKVEAAENVVKTYERNLAKAQADLNLKKAPARSEDVRLYEAQVLSAQADLSLALDRLDETIIRAPIDGVITATDGSVGEVSSMSAPVIKMLTNNVYEIEVDIPESDIAKVNPGDKVEITLDAFSSDDIFSGSITKVDPAETLIQGVIYYKVTAAFDDIQAENIAGLTEKIKPGMTANVVINTAKIENALIVPIRAVKEENGVKYVEILQDNAPLKLNVELGLRGDEGKSEVKFGLSEGQKVITFVRTK